MFEMLVNIIITIYKILSHRNLETLLYILDPPTIYVSEKSEDYSLSVETSRSAGIDVITHKSLAISPKSTKILETNIKHYKNTSCESNISFMVNPEFKSRMLTGSLSPKRGVIDEDYTGCYNIVLRNNSNDVIEIEAGKAVCQLTCSLIYPAKYVTKNININQKIRGDKSGLKVPAHK